MPREEGACWIWDIGVRAVSSLAKVAVKAGPEPWLWGLWDTGSGS